MEIGEQYIIRIEVDGRFLVYTAKIISQDSMFITFEDKFGKILTYNKSKIVSVEELKWNTIMKKNL